MHGVDYPAAPVRRGVHGSQATARHRKSIRAWARAILLPILAAIWTGFAAVWTYWTWYYEQVYVPSTAPVNITTEVSAESAGAKNNVGSKQLDAIELTISASNPGTRDIYLLKNYWAAYGYKIKPRQEPAASWKEAISDRINNQLGSKGGSDYENETADLVAANNAFTDTLLHPEEKLSRTFLFFVEKDTYDFVEVVMFLPSATAEDPANQGRSVVQAQYELQAGRPPSFRPSYYLIKSDGGSEALVTDEKGNYQERDMRRYGLQYKATVFDLSLAHSEPSQSATANPAAESSP